MNIFIKEQLQILYTIANNSPQELIEMILQQELNSMLSMSKKQMSYLVEKPVAKKNLLKQFCLERRMFWEEAFRTGDALTYLKSHVIDMASKVDPQMYKEQFILQECKH